MSKRNWHSNFFNSFLTKEFKASHLVTSLFFFSVLTLFSSLFDFPKSLCVCVCVCVCVCTCMCVGVHTYVWYEEVL